MKRGRPPIGETAMTNAERQRRWRASHRKPDPLRDRPPGEDVVEWAVRLATRRLEMTRVMNWLRQRRFRRKWKDSVAASVAAALDEIRNGKASNEIREEEEDK